MKLYIGQNKPIGNTKIAKIGNKVNIFLMFFSLINLINTRIRMTATGTAINAPESLLAMADPTEIAKKLTLKIELFLYNLIAKYIDKIIKKYTNGSLFVMADNLKNSGEKAKNAVPKRMRFLLVVISLNIK
jgi:hypothetical protein